MPRTYHLTLPRSLTGLILLAILAAGCSPFSPTLLNRETAPLPAVYNQDAGNATIPDKWWTAFGNDELNSLVDEAIAANTDIMAAWGRLRQARATAIQSGAGRFPSLNGSGDYSHTRQGQDNANGKRSITTTEDHSLGLDASYELDLWGRVSAQAMAGKLTADASRADLEAMHMTVAGEVVSKWLQIQEQREKGKILKAQIEANETYLELIELRYRNALSSALDVYQQRETVAQVKAELPPVKSEEQLLLNDLALLLGRPAGSIAVHDAELPALPPLPGLGLPADLLAKRPDIRSALMSLHSAQWSVSQAQANRLPAINITGNAAYSGAQLATVFDNWLLSLAASITGPIFDGGYNKAEVEKARGEVDEMLAEYKSTVYTAYKEAEDALSEEKWQKEYITARGRQLDAARTSLNEATSRYIQGLDDYLPVLTALLTVQQLEVSQVQDRTDLLLYRIALYRAMGGGWTKALKRPAGYGEEQQVTEQNQTQHTEQDS